MHRRTCAVQQRSSVEIIIPELLSGVNIARAIGQEKNSVIHHGSALIGSRQQANLLVQIPRYLVDLIHRYRCMHIVQTKESTEI